MGFVVSVLYDWGFLFASGLRFDVIPTSISDHVRTALVWLPFLLFAIFCYYAIEFQFQRIEKGFTHEEIVNMSKNPKKMKWFRETPYKILLWAGPLGILTFLAIGDTAAAWLPFCTGMLWILFATWCYSSPLIQLRRSRITHILFVTLPAAGLVAVSFGYYSFLRNAYYEPRQIIVYLEKNHEIKAKLLRTFESGTLIMTSTNKIQFIPASIITRSPMNQHGNHFRAFCAIGLRSVLMTHRDRRRDAGPRKREPFCRMV